MFVLVYDVEGVNGVLRCWNVLYVVVMMMVGVIVVKCSVFLLLVYNVWVY